MNIKFGTTKIFIKEGIINGTPVTNTDIDIFGLYLLETKARPVVLPADIKIADPATATLTRNTFTHVFTVTANYPLTFAHDDLIGLETESYSNKDNLHIYDIRAIHAMSGEGKSIIKITAENGETAQIAVQVNRAY